MDLEKEKAILESNISTTQAHYDRLVEAQAKHVLAHNCAYTCEEAKTTMVGLGLYSHTLTRYRISQAIERLTGRAHAEYETNYSGSTLLKEQQQTARI